MATLGAGVAITTVGVAATVQGVGIIGNSFNSLSDHIQNFKDSGISNNNNPKEFHNSIKDSSNYPEGFVERQNGTTKIK